MLTERYRGYDLWGHPIEQQGGILEPERFASSGTVTRAGKLVVASDVLGIVDEEVIAQQMGLDWARAWVDSHS
ncbi:hypothetical protein P5W99_37250 [Paraburkholderia sp. A3BS-1L]|uniref:hypothetical protein n=1 Tax=Paraburkholderia sp. A3BS-1L TaxID=3028375 RepID=UPI003DA7D610